MKNLKLLSLLGIALFSLLSFTYFDKVDEIKDGTYNGHYSVKSKRDISGFNAAGYTQDVTVKIENNIVKQISSLRNNLKADELLYLPMNFDSKGNAFVEATGFYQDVHNKNDQGRFYTYKLVIKNKELAK